MKDCENIIEQIKEKWLNGEVVLMTVEGVVSVPVREIINQTADGLLYDLNRDIYTSLTLFKNVETLPVYRIINDIAVAHIIEYLMAQRPYNVDACGPRGVIGGIPSDIMRKAQDYQFSLRPPYDEFDIINAYGEGAIQERNSKK